jgi:DNA (cytosine-5)-methyltransferase 1
MPIPVIDLFAGPGGLGEGFSAFRTEDGRQIFKIALSIEKEGCAHRTLELRSFFRHFPDKEAPEEYYDYLAGCIDREKLFKAFPEEAEKASQEAWHAELGGEEFSKDDFDARIEKVLTHRVNWILIGGPPCQAYSLAGRSRRKNDPEFADDEKHFLYEQYLRIIARHRPPIFVMENVKGLLSARVREQGIFQKILKDLKNPLEAVYGQRRDQKHGPLGYRLVSLVVRNDDPLEELEPEEFIVRAEDYGIPQARHRIVLIGIKDDIHRDIRLLQKGDLVPLEQVISDLPDVRSGLSKEPDSTDLWRKAIVAIGHASWLNDPKVDECLRQEIKCLLREVEANPNLDRGGEFIRRTRRVLRAHKQWFIDERLNAVCNHSTRSHIRADLHRYLFVSTFARVHQRSPVLNDFPPDILPLHQNVSKALKETKFNDRFRVQLLGRPSTTVTSHISKDGHYFIHPDPTQCRSLTVREAARLQTFPDNYFFEGPRTQQYHQVGNAVPPLLAHEIANRVADLFG